MLYAIIAHDAPNSLSKRRMAREQHLERLHTLQADGRLVIAGPHPSIDTAEPGEAGFSGSLIVAHFDSLEAAQSWADSDPYVDAGVYAHVSVKPFLRVFPANS